MGDQPFCRNLFSSSLQFYLLDGKDIARLSPTNDDAELCLSLGLRDELPRLAVAGLIKAPHFVSVGEQAKSAAVAGRHDKTLPAVQDAQARLFVLAFQSTGDINQVSVPAMNGLGSRLYSAKSEYYRDECGQGREDLDRKFARHFPPALAHLRRIA